MGKTKDSIQRRRKRLPDSLPTSVQKSYFMLTDKERDVLNLALSKYRSGRSEPILIGDRKLLKPALQLMNVFRLRIDEIKKDEAITSYTQWLESVQVIGTAVGRNRWDPKGCSNILSVFHYVSQEATAFGKVTAPALRERHEPLFGLLRSGNHLIQLCCLSGRKIVPDRGWWLAEGGVFPKVSDLRQGEASPFGVSNEFHVI